MTKKRKDISDYIYHWCKSEDRDLKESFDSLLSILKSNFICGSHAHTVKGCSDSVICFSETPFVEVLDGNFGRYMPFGIAFSKKTIFDMGGRHVIYQSENDLENTPANMHWRHVTYNPLNNNTDNWRDFTWEREWRLKTEFLDLNLSIMVIVVPSNEWKEKLLDHYKEFSELMNYVDVEILGAIEGYTPEVPLVMIDSLENKKN